MLAFEQPGGALRMRRRCLNGVVRSIIGIGAGIDIGDTAVEVVMDPSVAGWVAQATLEGWHVRGTNWRAVHCRRWCSDCASEMWGWC